MLHWVQIKRVSYLRFDARARDAGCFVAAIVTAGTASWTTTGGATRTWSRPGRITSLVLLVGVELSSVHCFHVLA